LPQLQYKASEDHEDLGAEHPGCGGRLWRVPSPSGIRFCMRPVIRFFNPNGLEIEKPDANGRNRTNSDDG